MSAPLWNATNHYNTTEEKQPKKNAKGDIRDRTANLPSLWCCGRTKKYILKHKSVGFTVVAPTVLISEWVYLPALVVPASLHPDPPSSPLGCGKSAQDDSRYWHARGTWHSGDDWLVCRTFGPPLWNRLWEMYHNFVTTVREKKTNFKTKNCTVIVTKVVFFLIKSMNTRLLLGQI